MRKENLKDNLMNNMKIFNNVNKSLFHFTLTLFLFINLFIVQVDLVSAAPIKCADSNSMLPSLVICGRGSESGSQCSQICELKHVGATLNNLMYLVIYLLVMLLPVYLIYIGVKMAMSQGIPEELMKVRQIAGRVIISIILFFCAWLIMYTIATIMGVRNGKSGGNAIPSFLINNKNTVMPGDL
jgi:hypothetical protein